MRRDAVIVGGGPSGAALGARLARAGLDVVLLERERGPHDKVCGEFLSVEADALLAELGIDARGLGAIPIDTVAVRRGQREAAAALPFPALSLSRRVLDEALLATTAASGAEVRRGARAQALNPAPGGWRVEIDGMGAVLARQAFLATGKHDLRGRKRPPGRQNDLIGFKQHWRLAPEAAAQLARRVEIHLFPGGYAGLEMLEEGRANLCLVVAKAAFVSTGRRWDSLLAALRESAPALAARLDGARACTARPLAISEIPYGYVRPRGDGLWRLGDQAAVIPSFTGEGVSMALESARLAAGFVLAGLPADDYQQAFARQVRGQVALASEISLALTSAWGQSAAMAVLGMAPALLGAVARGTRLRARLTPCRADRQGASRFGRGELG